MASSHITETVVEATELYPFSGIALSIIRGEHGRRLGGFDDERMVNLGDGRTCVHDYLGSEYRRYLPQENIRSYRMATVDDDGVDHWIVFSNNGFDPVMAWALTVARYTALAHALRACQGNRKQAATLLGVARSHVYVLLRQLKQYG